MKFFSEDEVRKLIEETNIHDGIRGTADDYLPMMKCIELPDKYGRLIDADKLADEYMRYLMVCFPAMQMSTANELVNTVKEAIKIAPTIVEATE